LNMHFFHTTKCIHVPFLYNSSKRFHKGSSQETKEQISIVPSGCVSVTRWEDNAPSVWILQLCLYHQPSTHKEMCWRVFNQNTITLKMVAKNTVESLQKNSLCSEFPKDEFKVVICSFRAIC
jgi:hypothetical protein